MAGAQVVREKGLETETGSGGAGGQRQRGRTGSKGLAEGQRGRCTRKVVGVEVGCQKTKVFRKTYVLLLSPADMRS